MSRRFGRNQKRKLVAQVAYFERKADIANELLKSARGSVIAGNRAIQEMGRILGENYVGLEPMTQFVEELRENYRIPKRTPVPYVFRMADSREVREAVVATVMELQVFKCRSLLDEMTGDVHLRLMGPHGQLGYAITRNAMQHLSVDRWVEVFTPMIAHEFAKMVKEHVQNRR